MKNRITIYGLDECRYCTMARSLCEVYDETTDLNYINISTAGITQLQLQKMTAPEIRTVPQIFMNDKYLGDYASLVAHFNAENNDY